MTSQQEISGFEPTGQLRPFCVDFACSIFSGLGFLPQPKDMYMLNEFVIVMMLWMWEFVVVSLFVALWWAGDVSRAYLQTNWTLKVKISQHNTA